MKGSAPGQAGPGWWRIVLKGQFAWTVCLVSLWAVWLFFLPVDPDYTSGELLDHLLAWRETGILYADPAQLPHRVLNYPPLFLALVRSLVAVGLPPMFVGRLLGSLGVAVALWIVFLWVRWLELPRGTAVLGLGLVGTSFPLIYASGQFHLEGWAVAGTVAGFWLGARGGRWALLSGLALATACFFKQTQVVLSLVALLWIWRYRPHREFSMALGAFAAVGAVGCVLITLAFGGEGWRHMVGYTVGTFSLRQLSIQYAAFVLSWVVFVPLAFHASLGNRNRWRDPRSWYLLGSALWTLSAIRQGSSYSYFLDLHLAVLLWVIPALERVRGYRLRGLLTLQMLIGSLVVGGVLGYDLQRVRRTAEALPSLCEALQGDSPYLVSGSPGLARACGRRPALHPFITASLSRQGLWSSAPFEESLAQGAFGRVLLSFDPREEVGGVNRERWTEGALRIFNDDYEEVGRWGEWRVLTPAPDRLP